MTTRLDRPVRRVVETRHHGPLVVELTREGLVFRVPRGRIRFTLPYGVAYQRAAEIHAAHERRLKAEARKAKRRAR